MFNNASRCMALILSVSIGAHFCSTQSRGAEPSEPMKIHRVELFPAGQGVFEYQSNRTQDVELTLALQSHELDDLLKSLVLKGFDTARVDYHPESEENDLGNPMFENALTSTRAEILQGFKGVDVSVTLGNVKKTGVIVSVELQSQLTSDGHQEYEVITLNTDNGLEQIKLTQETAVSFEDPKMKAKFARVLQKIGSTSNERNSVLLKLKKRVAGPAAIAFQTETAPWKCSYRIAKVDGEFQLIASAVIDNNSGIDWTDIELVLVIDHPLGFHTAVAKVQTTNRASIDLPTLFSARPPLLSAGKKSRNLTQTASNPIDQSPDPFGEKPRMGGMGGGMGGMGGGGMGMGGMGGMGGMASGSGGLGGSGSGSGGLGMAVTAPQEVDQEIENSDSFDFDSRRLGMSFTAESMTNELFGKRVHIRIANVTIPAGTSQTVFLPTIPHTIRPLSVHLGEISISRAFSAFEITLKDGYQLMAGPGTVWDDQGYVGDVMFPRMVSGVPQLVTYAVDQSITIKPNVLKEKKLPSKWEIVPIQSVDSICETSGDERIFRYEIDNESSVNKTIVIEHSARDGNWVPDLGKGERIGNNEERFRYETNAAGNSKIEFDVRETQQRQNLWQPAIPLPSLIQLKQRVDLPSKLAQLVSTWIAAHEKRNEKERKATAIDLKIKGLVETIDSSERQQKRIQELMKALVRDDELHNRYMKRLSSLEDDIEKATAELKEARVERKAME